MNMHKQSNAAPKACTHIYNFEASDADQQANNLTNWSQQYDQVSSGRFYGYIRELQLQGLQVFTEFTSKALRQSCNVWSDSIWIGLPKSPTQASRINGLSIHNNGVMCRPGGKEFELVTPENFSIFGVVVDQAKLKQVAETQQVELNWPDLIHHGRLHLPAESLQGLRYLLERLLMQNNQQVPEKLSHDMAMMALLEIVQKETPGERENTSFSKRKAIVDMVKEYLNTHRDNPTTIKELCDLCHVSRRTLQYSFENVLGISPLQYLRTARLNGVRRALIQAGPETLVSDIAAEWGFWHLSQFAQDYKGLFGESPSVSRNSSAYLSLQ